MYRIHYFLCFVIIFLLNTAHGFNIEKAKKDYYKADFKVSSIKEDLYEDAPAISISFTAPVAKDRLKNHYIDLKGGESEYWIISKDQTTITFPFVSPDTEYTITVSGEIRDINGQRLDRFYNKKVHTKKIEPSVNFTSSGHIISRKSPKKLTVTTVNVDKIDVDFFQIDETKISQFFDYMRKNGKVSYYTLNMLNQFGKHLYKGRFDLNPKKNQRTDYNIDLSKIRSLDSPGLYAAVITRVGSYDYDNEFAYFMYTNIGLHIRKYDSHFDVYAQDIGTGKPLKDVEIKILNKKGEISDKSRIDNKFGFTSFQIKDDQDYIIAKKGTQISVLQLNQNALDLSGLKNSVTSHSEYQIYAFGPRDLYRPSETIDVNILVRDFDGKLPPSMPVNYTLYKPDGSQIISENIQPESQGFYRYSYKTDSSSQTGKYKLQLNFGENVSSSYYFKVEEFLPERLDLKLFDGKADEKRVLETDDMIRIPVESKYLYGAPASGNKVDGFLNASIDPHPFENLKTFYFGDTEEKLSLGRQNFNEINLSQDGTGTLSMENSWNSASSPVRFNINASVYESGGRPVTRKTAITMLNGRYFIGVEPQFQGRPDSDTTVKVKIACVDRKGNWVKNKKLQVALIRKDRNWYWKYSSGRGWHWAWDENPVIVFSKSVYVEKNALVDLPLSWGSYRLEVKDNNTLTSYNFSTSWSWWANSEDKNMQKPDQISLGFDKSEYKPGDFINMKINPPQSGLALITVETSSGVLYRVFKQVRTQGTDVTIKTERSWNRHDIYASVMVIKPGDFEKTPVPVRSFGMIHIPVKRDNSKFYVEISAPEKLEPNREITAKIKVKGNRGIPSNTKVIVSLVDVGILNITRFKSPDAESYFFAPRRYNIDLFDNYGQVIDNIGPKDSMHRFGGGFTESDAELSRGGEKPKSDVMMVSFMSDPISINSKGEAEVSFKLPDFNGKLRWMAVVYSDEQFGNSDTETKIAEKVVSQISLPRFLASNDKTNASLDVHNMSGSGMELNIEFMSDGSLINGKTEKKIYLNNEEKRTFIFPVESKSEEGNGVINVKIYDRSKSINVNKTWNIGIRSAYPSVTRKIFTAINPDSSWTPEIKTDDLIQENTRFQMTISNKPPIDFSGHFNYLLHYPYGCLEQSTSSGYPWVIATPEVINKLGLDKVVFQRFERKYTSEFRSEQIDKAVSLVLNRIKSNGGFGTWSSSSPENEWLTAYAAEFLLDAKKVGANVGYSTMQSVNSRLRNYVQGNFHKEYRWNEDSDHYEFAFRSYAALVLSKQNLVNISELRRLSSRFENKTKDDGLSWMQMAVAFKLAGDFSNSSKCYSQALKERVRERYKYYGEYGSNIRDLSRITELALTYGFENAKSLLFELSNIIRERNWLSTQERISLFKTAILNELDSNENWKANLVMDNRVQKISKAGSFNTLFNSDLFRKLKRIEASDDTLYATISLVGMPKKHPTKQSNGMSVERSFYDMNGNLIELEQMKSGELAVVKIEVTSDKRTPDGLVVDLLPAGVEIENQNLGQASAGIDEVRIDGKKIGDIRNRGVIKHEEFRDDRYVAAIDVDTYRPVTLFYLIRAVTPGTYKFPNSYVEDMYRPYRFGIGESKESIQIFK